jgi:hypothetical protein
MAFFSNVIFWESSYAISSNHFYFLCSLLCIFPGNKTKESIGIKKLPEEEHPVIFDIALDNPKCFPTF